MKKHINLIIFSLGQGLSGSIISLLTLTSALVGKSLSPLEFLSTLPVTMTVLGSSIMVYYASISMQKFGRKKAFMLSGAIGIIGSFFAIISIYYKSFILFLISTFILGCATVFNQYYRFASAEIYDDELWKKKATSFVIGGGILGGILGPYLANKGIYLIPSIPFIGNFVFSLVVFIIIIIIQIFTQLKNTATPQKKIKSKNKIDKDPPEFILGTISCAVGFGLMTLIMNSAPLSMHNNNYSINQNSLGLQFHFIAMYLPSLFLPFLLKKIKIKMIIYIGSMFFVIGSFLAIIYNSYVGYFSSLLFAGIGWSFMFTGGTLYLNKLTEKYKHHFQGKSSLYTYLFNLLSSFSAGILLIHPQGWTLINSIAIFISIGFIIIFNILNNLDI